MKAFTQSGVRKPLLLLSTAALLAVSSLAWGNGTEELTSTGTPTLEPGTGMTGAGVGLEETTAQPGTIEVVIPAGSTVEQVILYWEGNYDDGVTKPGATDSISGPGRSAAAGPSEANRAISLVSQSTTCW